MSKTKMTKKQAEALFKEGFSAVLRTNDIPLKRMTWNDFTDHLQKSGEITPHQCATWTQPKFVNR